MSNYELKLKKIRKKQGITQKQLAEMLKTNQVRISEYETGAVVPSLERLIELAQMLDVSLDELIEFRRIQNKLSEELKEK